LDEWSSRFRFLFEHDLFGNRFTPFRIMLQGMVAMRVAATNPAAGKAAGGAQGVWRRRFGDALTGLAIWLPLAA
jgi:hypothetical protein